MRYLLVAAIAALVAAYATRLLAAPARPLSPSPDTSPRQRAAAGWGMIAATATGVGVSGDGDVDERLVLVGLALATLAVLGNRLLPAASLRVAGAALAAGGAVVLGVETSVTATGAANVLVVVVLVVVVVESLRILEVVPGGAATAAAPALVAVVLVGVDTGQTGVAVTAAAVAGGLAGVLGCSTAKPIPLGWPGGFLAGFFLTTSVVALAPDSTPWANATALVPLVVVPLAGAGVLALDRRRGQPLALRRPRALVGLAAVQSVVGAGSVLASRGSIPTVVPVGLAAAGALAVTASVRSARASPKTTSGPSWSARLLVIGLAVAGATAVVPAVVAMVDARASLTSGARDAERGLDAARQGEVEAARSALDDALAAFASAERSLGHPLASLGLAVPVLGPNLEAARTLSAVGTDLAAAGTRAAGAVNADRIRLRGAAIDVGALQELRQPLAQAAAALGRARPRLAAADSPWLVPLVADKVTDLADRVDQALPDASNAAAVAEVAPALLGGDGPRRYFVALQTPAELRGSGGLLGSFGELTAEGGRLDLVRTGRAADLNEGGTPESRQVVDLPPELARFDGDELAWQDVTLSPDFPTVATTIEQHYPRYGGAPVDGVLSLDPFALAALLELTGKVEVPEWPEPIVARNAADILLRQQYLRLGEGFSKPERLNFLDSLLEAVFDRLRGGELPGPGKVASVLAPMVREGRLKLHSAEPGEQAVFAQLRATGRLAPVAGDSVGVVTQNAGGNKIDIFLERALDYQVRIDPETGETEAVARVTLVNGAPSEGLPEYVIGSGGPVKSPPGTNRLALWFYSALDLQDATLDGAPLAMEPRIEQGRNVYRAVLSLPPGTTSAVELRLAGVLDGADYRLDLAHQPTIEPDRVSVAVAVPDPWRLADGTGLEVSATSATASLALDSRRTLSARFENPRP